jgi:hypothetical protein
MNQSRPSFYYQDNPEMELKAGGVLFYRFNSEIKEYELLLINTRNNYEDFGGRTDSQDQSIIETVSREVEEESNELFSKKMILDKMKNAHTEYIKHCKYILYFVELTDFIDPKLFGDREIHDNFDRTVEWVKLDQLLENKLNLKLNFRLKSWNVTNFLKKIKHS